MLNVQDALKLQSLGVDGLQVSSHGGRQLDSAPPPIELLAKIRAAVGADFPLFFDSGIRSGEDIVKAYACGADYVFIGRPFLFAIAAEGEAGLQSLKRVLTEETSITLAQLGMCSIREVNDAVIYRR